MSSKTLACGVPEDVYDLFVSRLPEGVSINAQVRLLVERWLAGDQSPAPMEPPFADAVVLPAGTQVVYDADQSLESQLGNPANQGPWVRHPVRYDRAEPLIAVDAEACLHPRGALVREGRSTVCSLCGRHISIT